MAALLICTCILSLYLLQKTRKRSGSQKMAIRNIHPKPDYQGNTMETQFVGGGSVVKITTDLSDSKTTKNLPPS